VPVPDGELPLLLPEDGYQLLPSDGRSPLATAEDWVSVPCPRCGGPASRDTDTMDTFVDSSWYFLRYPGMRFAQGPFNPAAVRRWLPVTDYIGGRDHATGHLIYARFITKVLHDLGLIDFVEPFARLTNQGHVTMNGRAMSKSLGNLVDLRGQIARYGPDAVRVTMLFAGPPGDDIDWADVSQGGAVKFLNRVGQLAAEVGARLPPYPRSSESDLRRQVHRLVAEVTAMMECRRFNVAIAKLMKLTSVLRRAAKNDPAVREGTELLVRMLSCFAPFTAEEAWERLGHGPSVVDAGWPEADPALAARETATCVIQVNGKVRERLEVPADIDGGALLERALALPRVAEEAARGEIVRTVVRPPRIVNVVVRPRRP
jgi:leucyl-tRNA synthetase